MAEPIRYIGGVRWVIDASRSDEEPYRIDRLERVKDIFYTILHLRRETEICCKSIRQVSLYDHKGVLAVTLGISGLNSLTGLIGPGIQITEGIRAVFEIIKAIWEGVEHETETEFLVEPYEP